MTGVSPDEFRDLLGHFTTGVTVLTARASDGRPHGITANAVTAVSLVPPLALVCVDHAHDIHAVLSAGRHFALNVLAADQEAISRRFAEDNSDRFAGVTVSSGPHGLPLLGGTVGWVVCEKREAVPAGDHTIFIGFVTEGETSDRPPLTFFRGIYGGLAQGTSPPVRLPPSLRSGQALSGEGGRRSSSVTEGESHPGGDRADG